MKILTGGKFSMPLIYALRASCTPKNGEIDTPIGNNAVANTPFGSKGNTSAVLQRILQARKHMNNKLSVEIKKLVVAKLEEAGSFEYSRSVMKSCEGGD